MRNKTELKCDVGKKKLLIWLKTTENSVKVLWNFDFEKYTEASTGFNYYALPANKNSKWKTQKAGAKLI